MISEDSHEQRVNKGLVVSCQYHFQLNGHESAGVTAINHHRPAVRLAENPTGNSTFLLGVE
jgi:hypothetical protein